jgi:hypothetical protein
MRLLFSLLLISQVCIVDAQDTIPNKKRLNLIRYGGAATYTVGMIGLNELWYRQSGRQSFSFFNDAAEWKQVDKVGHFYSTFQVSHLTYKSLAWANVAEKRCAISGALVGFGILSSIEIFDGFSSGYGASVSDLAANASGSLLFWGQMAGWQEVRIHPKFSFSRSSKAPQNPDLLGKSFSEEVLKDYNGQTYWLSIDMDKFMRFPKWLNLAAGYGANNMVNARDSQNIDPYRQFYLSVDFDLTSFHPKSKALRALIFFANMVKLPAPAIEFSPKGIRGHVLTF